MSINQPRLVFCFSTNDLTAIWFIPIIWPERSFQSTTEHALHLSQTFFDVNGLWHIRMLIWMFWARSTKEDRSIIDTIPSKRSGSQVHQLQDSSTAKALAFHKDVRTRCITLEGDDFNPGGLLTGANLTCSLPTLCCLCSTIQIHRPYLTPY